ncbi:trypco2 family protein [Streptomyces sp. NBC_00203]|uniref:trypco2 family protein n=1 Tax=Streptomyces sp. NBC_00203 TaxID=2975680 RepID=UPI0032530362
MPSESEPIDLVEAIKAVRLQLKQASLSARDDEIQMDVDTLELEFTVEVRRDLKAKGGVKAWVISTDVEAGIATSGTHRVKISLKPRTRITGESVKVGDEQSADGSEGFPFS